MRYNLVLLLVLSAFALQLEKTASLPAFPTLHGRGGARCSVERKFVFAVCICVQSEVSFGNAGIEFKSDKKNKGVEVYPQQNDNQYTYRTIKSIVLREVCDVKVEALCC